VTAVRGDSGWAGLPVSTGACCVKKGRTISRGPAALIAAAILSAASSSTFISVYLAGCAVISMVALLLMPRQPVEMAPAEFDETADRLKAEEGAGARA
jgi:hypothetical protein